MYLSQVFILERNALKSLVFLSGLERGVDSFIKRQQQLYLVEELDLYHTITFNLKMQFILCLDSYYEVNGHTDYFDQGLRDFGSIIGYIRNKSALFHFFRCQLLVSVYLIVVYKFIDR